MRRVVLASALTTMLFLVAGCGGDESDSAATPEPPVASTAGAVPFDRAFIDGMVPHHEQAIEMARAAKAAGLRQPELVGIADAIIATQQQEIDRMRGWRAEWFGSSEIDPQGAETLGLSMEAMGMQHGAADLSGADDVDSAFATMMVDHHNGAIAMAELALERGQHSEIRGLAEAVIDAQQREVEVMEQHAAMQH